MNKRIFLSPPHMGGDEIKYINEAFETNWVAPVGPHLDAFEKELCTYSGAPYCAALSSGTAGIHLALMLLNIGRGDEVVCSSFTFAGSCNPIVYVGATPIFVDSEAETWNLDPVLLREAIEGRIAAGRKPKAVIVVHLYGMPAKVDELFAVAREFDLPVIEDAAEGIGSSYSGKKLGSFGDLGVYSFNGNKIITTSGGGALVSANKPWIDKARFLATQARDPAPHYQHSEIGYNYRLSNISAGIGLGQLKVLDERVRSRRLNFEFYEAFFRDTPGISFQPEARGSYSNRWLTCMLIDRDVYPQVPPETIRLALEGHNIESRPLWKPMHLQPVYRDAPNYVSGVSERLFNTGICLPSGTSLTPADLTRIASIVKDTLNR